VRCSGFYGSTSSPAGSTPPIPAIAPATTEQKYEDEYDQN
jgi:hypothetical protein